MASWAERLIGVVLVIVAASWAAYHLASAHEFQPGLIRLGPMQLFMAGLLVWLHGKYRVVHFARARREYQTRFRDL